MGGRHPATASTTASAASAASVAAVPQQSGGQPFNHITLSSNGYFLTNGNGGVGVQLIPTKLTNGNIAFVVPPNGLQFQTPAQASVVAVHQQLQQQPQSNTPLPMLIPIPNRQQTAANSAPSDTLLANNNSTGASRRSSDSSNNSSHSSLARSASTSPQHHHYHMQHVTSSAYDRRTPSSSYGSMDSQTMSPPHSPQSSGMCLGPLPYKRARSSPTSEHFEDNCEERESECHSPGPLSLVVRKRSRDMVDGDVDADVDGDKQCWRPW